MNKQNINKSIELFTEAQKHFPGGVNSPVRAFKSVGGQPIFIKSAKGSKITDIDGNEYLDFVGTWGPTILGHANEKVIEKLHKKLERGLSFGAPCKDEIKLAAIIKEYMPSIEMMRFVSSGTEACMGAVRLARAYTKRDKIIKFSGNYHGHFDSFLVQAGSGVATLGMSDSLGVPASFAEQTIIAEYNNLESVQNIFEKYPEEIAGLIVEPIVGNSGCLIPQDGFLQGLRSLCDKYKSLLIFDEVMTGFRVARGGAQELFNIKPDLTTLGKIVGGGLPVALYGGKKEIMETVAPLGGMYQAGTLSGNPLGMVAGYQTLRQLRDPEIYKNLTEKLSKIKSSIQELANKHSLPLVINGQTAMFTLFFTELQSVNNWNDASKSNTENFAKFFNLIFEKRIYFPPSQFEAAFLSTVHSDNEINQFLEAINYAFKNL